MAEEVITYWENVNRLVTELVNGGNSKERIAEFGTPETPPGSTMRFKLVDESGTEVKFPLRLISDTKLLGSNLQK